MSEDWEDGGSTSAPARSGGGFSSFGNQNGGSSFGKSDDAFGLGIGRGRGRGRGRGFNMDPPSNPGSKGGFGSGLSNGGGSSWSETPSNGGGRSPWESGDGGGGFGKKGGDSGGFGSRSFGGGDRGGSRGGDSGGGGRSFGRSDGEGGEAKPPASTYIPPTPSEEEEHIYRSTQQGINFDKYDDIPVEVTGRDKPRNIRSFEEAELADIVMDNVRKAHYAKPTPVQKYGVPIIAAGRDLMACAQTGSGKTAAFLLPIISSMITQCGCVSSFNVVQEPLTLIVSPTRELAVQIYNEARKFCRDTPLRPVTVYGGTSVNHQMKETQKGCSILVATPGRLHDFINRGYIGLGKLKFLVLDEADRMLDMGFGPEIQRLIDHPHMPPKGERQTLMFSATFPNEVQERAGMYLNDYLFLTVGRVGGAASDIDQRVYAVGQFAKREKLMEILRDQKEDDRTLVFVETKRNADFLASLLSQSEFPTTSIHGDRQQQEREEALHDFKSGKAPILVATSVAARGLDIPGVKHVVNYDLPSDIAEYVHRIGRTGRVGNLGRSTSFYDADKDSNIARALIKVLADAQQEVPEFLEEAADSAIGTYHGNAGGSFGGRDTRKFGGRGGGRGGGGGGGGSYGGDDWGSGGGGGGGGADAGGDDESWE